MKYIVIDEHEGELYLVEAPNGQEAVEKLRNYLPDGWYQSLLDDFNKPILTNNEKVRLYNYEPGHPKPFPNWPQVPMTLAEFKAQYDLTLGGEIDMSGDVVNLSEKLQPWN